VQIIYLFPFVVLSGLSGVICLVVPRWRRYVAGAVIGPVVFAVCAITGLFAVVLLADHFLRSQQLGFDKSWENSSTFDVVIVAALYIVSGLVGAVPSTVIANWLQRWVLRRWFA
jgi:hypothetical protein